MFRTTYKHFYITLVALAVALGLVWPLYFIWVMSGISFWFGLIIYLFTCGAAIIATCIFVYAFMHACSVTIETVAQSEH